MGNACQISGAKFRPLHALVAAVVACTLPMLALAEGKPTTEAAPPTDASAAFEQLKNLAGHWTGEGEHRHEIVLSAGGTVVMETMGPGTAHEMINMYFLDGERLLLTHYCAGGNQPQMQLQPQDAANVMRFDYVGGTNLDPAVDSHIHAAKIVLVNDDTIESHWTGYEDGEPHHDMIFHLSRQGG